MVGAADGAKETKTDSKTDSKALAEGDGGETVVPELPDVPKDDPKEPGQPDHKKARLDDKGRK